MPLTTTFDTVYSYIKSECARGNSVDAVLAGKIQQAVTFIERNYTLKYMEQFLRFKIFPNENAHGPYAQPPGLKSTKHMRITLPTREFRNLRKGETLEDQKTFAQGLPYYYFEIGDYYWFDSAITSADAPDGFLWTDILASCYTPRLLDDSRCWLFDYAMDVVVAKSMELMAPWLRQPAIIPAYSGMWLQGVKTLLTADAEARREDTEITWGQNRDPNYAYN